MSVINLHGPWIKLVQNSRTRNEYSSPPIWAKGTNQKAFNRVVHRASRGVRLALGHLPPYTLIGAAGRLCRKLLKLFT